MKRPVRSNWRSMNGANSAGSITPSSICFALRQNGSFSSLNSRRSMWRLEPR